MKDQQNTDRRSLETPDAVRARSRSGNSLGLLVAALLVGGAAGMEAEVITYDGSATPNWTQNPFPFSWNYMAGTRWSVTNGVLKMTTSANPDIWFGKHTVRPVPWKLADPKAGNYVKTRVKLDANSSGWACYLYDGTHQAYWTFDQGYVSYTILHEQRAYNLSTTDFHDYEFRLQDGQVNYLVDGVEIYSGPAESRVYTDGSRYLVIGAVAANQPVGSVFVDGVRVITEVGKVDQASIRVSQVEVCWLSLTNKVYQMQYKSALTTNLWTDLGPPRPGADATICVPDSVPLGEPQRFYRVVVEP